MDPHREKINNVDLTRSDTNQAGQPLKVARGLKFCIKEVEVLYYQSSVNKDTEADLRPCFCINKTLVSHEAAQW